MRHLIERLDRAVVAEAKKPYEYPTPAGRQQAAMNLHNDVATKAYTVLKAVEELAKTVQKGREVSAQMTGPEGTFAETQEKINEAGIGPLMVQIATDHIRWAKSLRAARNGE